jgi:hypothetical protein
LFGSRPAHNVSLLSFLKISSYRPFAKFLG